MEKIVVDSSVAVKWFVIEADSMKARQILLEYKQGLWEFLAPDLIYAEYGNIIWKKQIFQSFDEADANSALEDFQDIQFTITHTRFIFKEAFQIAVKHKRTFYDSLYLALSVKENCEFVTADEKFYNSVSKDFPKMILLSNWQ
ncbi:type II toxin-antitoxin system VapC family toxin [soil metagenome]